MIAGQGAAGTVVVMALVCFFAAFAGAANLKLKPGKYALTITYEVQDQRQNESRTAIRCITPRNLNDPETIFNDRTAAAPKGEDACSVKDLKSDGGKISYDAECSSRVVHVEGNVSDTRFAVVRTVRPKASEEVSLKFTISGRRTGDCLTSGKR